MEGRRRIKKEIKERKGLKKEHVKQREKKYKKGRKKKKGIITARRHETKKGRKNKEKESKEEQGEINKC